MTRQGTAPPPIAEWLVGLVATPEQTVAIVGDLIEEFSVIVGRSGTAVARRWYWRQVLRTLAHLMRGQVRRSPVAAVAFGIGGFLFYVLAERALQTSAQAVALSDMPYPFGAIAFWWAVDNGTARYVVPIMVGWIIARAARGREIVGVVSVGVTVGIWILAIYTSALLDTSGIARIHVPDFSIASLFCPPESGPPHGASIANTLRLLRFTLIYWWIPTIAALVAGAVIRRATSSRRILGRGIAQ